MGGEQSSCGLPRLIQDLKPSRPSINKIKVVDKLKCKWLSDEFSAICVNSDCPACADGCPTLNYPEICKYAEDKGEDNEQDN